MAPALALKDDPVWTALENAPRLTQGDLSAEEWAAWDESMADYKAGSAELVDGAGVRATIKAKRSRTG